MNTERDLDKASFDKDADKLREKIKQNLKEFIDGKVWFYRLTELSCHSDPIIELLHSKFLSALFPALKSCYSEPSIVSNI